MVIMYRNRVIYTHAGQMIKHEPAATERRALTIRTARFCNNIGNESLDGVEDMGEGS